MTAILGDIEAAARRLRGVAVRTPLLSNAVLDEAVACRVFIKAENLQHGGAFKFRGAYNRLAQLSAAERARGVVAYSSGNHAQGVAYAARLLGIRAVIVMPADAPRVKLDNTRRLGAVVREYDRASESREAIAEGIARETGAVLVPAFDDPHIIAGQGSCGLEAMEQLGQLGQQPDLALAPCGGGGLLAGFSSAVKAARPSCRVVGVEPEHYDDHCRSHAAGRRVRIRPTQSTACDALMATMPGELTWEINRRTVASFVAVSEGEVARAVSFAARYLKLIVEPGGAVALAALLAGKCAAQGGVVALVLSGGNIDPLLLGQCLDAHPQPL